MVRYLRLNLPRPLHTRRRRSYVDGAAAAAHMEKSVGPVLTAGLAPFVSRVEVHGPPKETAAVRPSLPDAIYFDLM